MKNTNLLKERRELKRIAGLLKEDDYSMGTPSGDTNAMGNISEYGPSSVQDIGTAINVVNDAIEYVKRFADTEEADEEGFYGMNEAGQLAQSLEDVYDFLQGMNTNG